MDRDLCDKFQPKTIADVVGNTDFIQKLTTCIKECKEGAFRGIIKGVCGSGKSTIPKLVLEQMGYHVINIDHMYLTDDDDKFQQALMNFGNSKTIDHFMFRRKYALCIDSIDEIAQISKKCYNQCIAVFKSSVHQPILITYTTSNEKNVSEISKSKKYPILTISAPSSFETRVWVQKILQDENIMVDEELVYKYIKHCQNKIGKILMNLRNISQVLNEHEEHIQHHDQFVDRYTTDIAFDICSRPESFSISQLDHILHYDHSSVSTCIHENMSTITQERCGKRDTNQIDFMIRCMDVFTDGDLMDTYVCTNRAWQLTSTSMLSKIGRLKNYMQALPKQTDMFKTFGYSSMASKFTKQVQYYKRNTDMLLENDMTDVNFQVTQWHIILLACAVISNLITKQNAKVCTHKADLDMTLQYVEDNKSETLKQAVPLIKGITKTMK
jgi:uridine kinase